MTPLEKAKQRFTGKRVLVMGLGLLGGAVGDVRFFSTIGASVRATDKKTATELEPSIAALKHFRCEFSLGGEKDEDIDWADCILRNPSIPQSHPLLERARQQGKPIMMRSTLFAELSDVNVVGITGTRGKTTTTVMVYELLKQLTKKQILLAGNIAGISDLELLEQIHQPNDFIAVMELSSWQLQGFKDQKISPHIAVITNLLPDHLNAYPNLELYYQDKKAILDYQQPDDYAILNADQPEFKSWTTSIPSQVRWVSPKDLSPELTLQIPGEHNRINAALALEVCRVLELDISAAINILNQFQGVPFRLQKIATKNSISFINDTTATTPTACMAALASCVAPPILICGGADKRLPLESFAQTLNHQTKSMILLSGSGTELLKPLLDTSKIAAEVNSMQAAVSRAVQIAQPGDTILLSPGFASFGLFNNEFDRGEQFNQCVNVLP